MRPKLPCAPDLSLVGIFAHCVYHIDIMLHLLDLSHKIRIKITKLINDVEMKRGAEG